MKGLNWIQFFVEPNVIRKMHTHGRHKYYHCICRVISACTAEHFRIVLVFLQLSTKIVTESRTLTPWGVSHRCMGSCTIPSSSWRGSSPRRWTVPSTTRWDFAPCCGLDGGGRKEESGCQWRVKTMVEYDP